MDSGTTSHGTADAVTSGKKPARGLRACLLVVGTLSFGLGVLGAVLPLLPTTPFVLLAAACYARSSTRLHQRLLESDLVGPTLREWQERRSFPARAKVAFLAALAVSLSFSAAYVTRNVWSIVPVLGGVALLSAVILRPRRTAREGNPGARRTDPTR